MSERLPEGFIPPHTKCPFRDLCCIADRCHHQGKDHTVRFSCAMARAFDLFHQEQADKETK